MLVTDQSCQYFYDYQFLYDGVLLYEVIPTTFGHARINVIRVTTRARLNAGVYGVEPPGPQPTEAWDETPCTLWGHSGRFGNHLLALLSAETVKATTVEELRALFGADFLSHVLSLPRKPHD